ncbi:MAG: energy transducer TonB, partial [Myxococcus sp.]|nr:energy transducer TonB [Myxococcus sp.]
MNARTESLLEPRPTPIVPFVAASLVAHVVVGVLLLAFSWLFTPPKLTLDQEPIKASL